MTSKLITLTTKEDIELICLTYNYKHRILTPKVVMSDPNRIAYLQTIEEVVQQKIEFLVSQHDPIARKLEVVKELFLDSYVPNKNRIEAVRGIRTITKCSLKEAINIVDTWVKEYEDSKNG